MCADGHGGDVMNLICKLRRHIAHATIAALAAIGLPGSAALAAGSYCPTSVPGVSSGAFVVVPGPTSYDQPSIKGAGEVTAPNAGYGSAIASDYPGAINIPGIGNAVFANYATSGDGNSGNAVASIGFTIEFCAPPGSTVPIPLDIYGSGQVTEFTTGKKPPGAYGQAEMQIYRQAAPTVTLAASEDCTAGVTCQPNNGELSFFNLDGSGEGGTGEVLVQPNTGVEVILTASVIAGGLNQPPSLTDPLGVDDEGDITATVDPIFEINPTFLATHPGYSLEFSAGIASPPTSSTVPEPSTWAMLIVGFLGLGFAGWRRRAGRAAIA
jgi:hypothetical protein